ncbi:serine/threonine-protein kinase pim-2-like [Misgurnus anguillicaudatus]|uniref:serine/threonine-protein kinase pim-2-like n=1 Tax=Misgurnus anguillicaudatus TaxID=75329 RepID=UPI003CCFC95B
MLKVAKEPEPKVEENPTLRDFHSKYEANLIEGHSAKVFKGIRKADGKEVAISFVNINSHTKFLSVPGYSKPLPEEVAVMLKLREAPECPYVIQMYDWYEMDNKFILVFEYLRNCDKLWTYIRLRRKLKEDKARYLLVQLLRAVKHCLDNGVLHSSITSNGILVEKSSLHLKLCDFDYGILVGSDGYSTTYNGYKHAASPEDWNVCQLSFLLYEMLNGQEIYPPYCTTSEEFKFYNPFVSRDAFDLIHWGIGMPEDRPTIHQFLAHDWFKDEGLLDINQYEQPAVYKTFEDDWTTKEWRRKLKALKEKRRTFIKKKGL